MKRIRRRYLAVSIESSKRFNSDEFMSVVWGALSKLYGEYGASRSNLSLIDYSGERKVAVIRVGHEMLQPARAALASVTRVENEPVTLHILAVSGTLKALHEKAEKSFRPLPSS